METVKLGTSDVVSSRLVYGCMRIVGDNSTADREKGKQAVRTALEAGYTHFDHADIYGGGKCEELFAEVLRELPKMRESIVLTSKCGIRKKGDPEENDPVRYDFSKDYILKSVEGSLARLQVDFLDILLLHRPDYLFDPEEVAAAFHELHVAGKVLHFGVSNFRPSQVSLLQSYCPFPLVMNQVEINLHNLDALTDGVLDQCRELKMTPQAWSPVKGVCYSARNNMFSAGDEARIRTELEFQAGKYGVEDWVVMLAWLLRHPAGILPIIGSTTPARIVAAKQALAMAYSRADWYRLFEARNGHSVP